MTAIRVLALGVALRGERLLAMEVRDAAGRFLGVRPLGGGIDFQENAVDALKREFREEAAAEIAVLGAPAVFENIFAWNHQPKHEIVFAFPIALTAPGLAAADRFEIREGDGLVFEAVWTPLSAIAAGATALLPPGLAAELPAFAQAIGERG